MVSLYIFAVLLINIRLSYCQDTCGTVNCIVANGSFCEISQSSNYSLRKIEACFGSNYQYALFITKNAPGDVIFIIDSDMGARPLLLGFVNLSPQGKFIVRASATNKGVRTIFFSRNGFHIDQTDFFDHFPLVNDITTPLAYITFGFRPSFSKLIDLNVLQITVSDPKEELTILTADMLQNTSIELFRWSGSLKSIEPSAFNSLRNLTHLDLTANFLTTLPDGLFNHTEKIENIILDRNMIDSLSIDFFDNLNSITSISINYNRNFPYESLRSLGTLRTVSLDYNSYRTLDNFPFQQLHKLEEVSLVGNPFHCDCELRWLQFLSSSGVIVTDGICFSPISTYSINITDEILYAICPSNETFPCFNKSITCPGNFFCHNKGENFKCHCAEGQALYHTDECIDLNECTPGNLHKCEHLCVNTFGSYKCDCYDGYRLKSDGISCEDVNECAVDNGGCAGGCRNADGSFSCVCETGFVVVNGTACDIGVSGSLFITWGSVVSLLAICLILSLVITCICLCYSKSSNRPAGKLASECSVSVTPSTYTRMEAAKPDVPKNRPQLPPPRSSSSDVGSLSRRPIVHEELTYEAFDVEN